jgi:SAM-dependent methyltransferase
MAGVPPEERFEPGIDAWLSGVGLVRDAVRQELVSRRISTHLSALDGPLRVLDTGSGQGTQAIALARLGHEVVGIDLSDALLEAARRAAADEPDEVQLCLTFEVGDLLALADGHIENYDLVCCHGVAMYLPSLDETVRALAGATRPGGLISLLTRNRARIAMRAGMTGRWMECIAARSMPGPLTIAWASNRFAPTSPTRSTWPLSGPARQPSRGMGFAYSQITGGKNIPPATHRHCRHRRGGRTPGTLPLGGSPHPHHRSSRNDQALGPYAISRIPVRRDGAAEALIAHAFDCQAPLMDLAAAQHSTKRVGVTTLPIGIALVVAPSRAGHVLRTGDHPTALRLIGASDLVLVPGLLRCRHPQRWMAARIGLNVVIAAYCLLLARRGGAVGAKIAIAGMVAATISDGRTIAALRRGE